MHEVTRTDYLREFGSHWTNLLGAALGLAFGSALNHYVLSLFGPDLLREFGWTKSEFALVGTLGLASIVLAPVLGRFVDLVGARTAAIVGFLFVPSGFFGLSLMTGEIWQFYALILVVQSLGILTTTLVFTRVVIERFDKARGLALAILMSGAPMIGAIIVPIIGEVIATQGWRTAYQVLAALSAAGGVAAVILMGQVRHPPAATQGTARRRFSTRDLTDLMKKRVFVLLIIGMLLVNFPQVIVMSQLKLVLLEKGAADAVATWIISFYAIGVVVGRIISGFALDRIPAHYVSGLALGLPAIGFLALASPLDAAWVMGASVLLVGLAQGAEGDVGAYLTSKNFALSNYSFVFSMLIVAMGISSAAGAGVLSLFLQSTSSFAPFLLVCAFVTVLGAMAFFLTGRFGDGEDHQPAREKAEHQSKDSAIATSD